MMKTPSTGKAEDLKRLCRNHSQENPPASNCVFFLFFVFFFPSFSVLDNSDPQKGKTGGWKAKARF